MQRQVCLSSENKDTLLAQDVRECIKEDLELEISLKGQIRCSKGKSRRAFYLDGDIKTGIDVLN